MISYEVSNITQSKKEGLYGTCVLSLKFHLKLKHSKYNSETNMTMDFSESISGWDMIASSLDKYSMQERTWDVLLRRQTDFMKTLMKIILDENCLVLYLKSENDDEATLAKQMVPLYKNKNINKAIL